MRTQIEGYRPVRQARHYRHAVRRAFATVTFYREQCAEAGRMLAEPRPTPLADLPDPPHALCPFARPWSAAEPPLWGSRPVGLARALRLAGCGAGIPVLEVRDALLDLDHLPGVGPLRGRRYAVLLSSRARVASLERRAELTAAALGVAATAGVALVVGTPEELAGIPDEPSGLTGLEPVWRVPVSAVAVARPVGQPVLLHEPRLGYLGALVPGCGSFHLDWRRVHARDRDGALALSLIRQRRPTLLDIMPSGADAVTVDECSRHGSPVLRAR